ncbi:BMP family ABC transporter substrate-binding protein [Pseudovibrio hongkongensis]|uniref:BMP family ABC transporter substrate-binding protein n=1 Tax=Polycladidibacter hongkongensis TaxID=1647556 RepID=UPI0008312C78
MRRLYLLIAIPLLTLLGAFSSSASVAAPLKVGFLYVGPISDHGWSFQHEQGRKAVDAHFGDKVETTFIENVAGGADAIRAIERLARDGNTLIFTTSFSFMNPTLRVAKKYPQVKFENATGFKQAKNVGTYSARFYEGRYVIGQMAGQISKAGIAAYVAPFPVPEVIRGMNAFVLGARTVNPDFKIKVVWTNSWYDPAKEADAAKALIDQGADVLVQHTDSPAPLQIAQEKGIIGFGQSSDMAKFAPNSQVTSIVDDWAPYYIERVQAVLDGNWKAQDTWGGLKTGMVKLSPIANVEESIAERAQETIGKLENGEIIVFQGPLNKQDGSSFLAKGASATDQQLLQMNFYLEGMDGKLPN